MLLWVLICTFCRKAEQEEELAVYKQQDSLYRALVACLARDGFRLGMDVSLKYYCNGVDVNIVMLQVSLDPSSRIFFFMRTRAGSSSSEIKLPNMLGAGLGEKESLAVYRYWLFIDRYYTNLQVVQNVDTKSSKRWAPPPNGCHL